MKVSKSMLKSLVKECLVEILTEGVGSSLNENLKQLPRRGPASKQDERQRQITPNLRNAIITEAKGDPVLASILADTASSTLPMMLQNDGRTAPVQPRPSGIAEQIVAAAAPDQIFGDEVASKWADLAFMDTKQKK